MDTAPFIISQWDDCRTLDTRQDIRDFLHLRLWCIHHHILLVLSRTHSFETEQHFVQNLMLLFIHIPITNKQSLALHHDFHLCQIIANKGRA